MYDRQRPVRAFLSCFQRDEKGSISAESVIWMPIYMLFFALIADVSMMFHSQTKAMRIVQDANRLASFQVYKTADEVEANVRARLVNISENATVETKLGTDAVATMVSFPVKDVAIIGLMGTLMKFDISVSSMHLVES